MKKVYTFNLFITTMTLLVCFVSVEIGIRYLGRYDSNRNFIFGSTILKPYHLPIKSTKLLIDRYLSSITSRLQFDSDLGWAPRPNSKSDNGYYVYNSVGIRSEPIEYSKTPHKSTLRIAIFGDSVTHGDEVPFEETWGYYLENNLRERGIDAEVLNFGVSGYGMDQAFLRWEKMGYEFSPHVVIFGFQPGNVKRNVNLIRPLIHPKTAIPFSKPRFVEEEDKLRLINVPAVNPEKIPGLLMDLVNWDIAKYEYFYNPFDYEDHIWLRSKLIALAISALYGNREWVLYIYDLKEKPARLAKKIIG